MADIIKKFTKKYSGIIASIAVLFATLGANINCIWPYYEPKEPENLSRLKKFA